MASGLRGWFGEGEQELAERFMTLLEAMPVLTLEPATLDAWADGLAPAERATLVGGALSLEQILHDEPAIPGAQRMREAGEGQRTRVAARFCATVVMRCAAMTVEERERIARRRAT